MLTLHQSVGGLNGLEASPQNSGMVNSASAREQYICHMSLTRWKVNGGGGGRFLLLLGGAASPPLFCWVVLLGLLLLWVVLRYPSPFARCCLPSLLQEGGEGRGVRKHDQKKEDAKQPHPKGREWPKAAEASSTNRGRGGKAVVLLGLLLLWRGLLFSCGQRKIFLTSGKVNGAGARTSRRTHLLACLLGRRSGHKFPIYACPGASSCFLLCFRFSTRFGGFWASQSYFLAFFWASLGLAPRPR